MPFNMPVENDRAYKRGYYCYKLVKGRQSIDASDDDGKEKILTGPF